MGLGGIELRVRGTLQDGTATLAETGQQLPVSGGPPRADGPWLWFEARDYGLELEPAVQWKRGTQVPAPGM